MKSDLRFLGVLAMVAAMPVATAKAQTVFDGGGLGLYVVRDVKYWVDARDVPWPRGVYYRAIERKCPHGGRFDGSNCLLLDSAGKFKLVAGVNYHVDTHPSWPGVYYPKVDGGCPHGGAEPSAAHCRLVKFGSAPGTKTAATAPVAATTMLRTTAVRSTARAPAPATAPASAPAPAPASARAPATATAPARATAPVAAVAVASAPAFTLEYDTERGGSDMWFIDMGDVNACRAACEQQGGCKGFTFVRPGVRTKSGRCHLKYMIAGASKNSCCISGVRGGVAAPAIASAGDFNAKTPSRKDEKTANSLLGVSAPLRQVPAPAAATAVARAPIVDRASIARTATPAPSFTKMATHAATRSLRHKSFHARSPQAYIEAQFGFNSSCGRKIPGVGEVVSVKALEGRIKARIEKGGTLPGESLPSPEMPLEKMKGKEKPPSKPPLNSYREDVIPALDRYIGEMSRRVLRRVKDYTVVKFESEAKEPGGAVDWLYNHSCKLVSKFIPGLARVVVKKVPKGGDLAGSWDVTLSKDEITPGKKGKDTTPLPTPGLKELKERTIEVCTVTHAQLHEMLRDDVWRMLQCHLNATPTTVADDLPPPITNWEDPKDAKSDLTTKTIFDLASDIKLGNGEPLNKIFEIEPLRDACKEYDKVPRWAAKPVPPGTIVKGAMATDGIDKSAMLALASKKKTTHKAHKVTSKMMEAVVGAVQAASGGESALKVITDINVAMPEKRDVRDIVCSTVGSVSKPAAGLPLCNHMGAAFKGSCTFPWDRVCQGKFAPKDGVKMIAWVLDEEKMTIGCQVDASDMVRLVSETLKTDMGTFDKLLGGANFGSIADKYVSFLRKGGELRDFKENIDVNQKAKRLKPELGSALRAASGDKETAKELTGQNEDAEKRAFREVLSRGVDKWTDAYEYIQMVGSLGKKPKNLFDKYKKAEVATLAEFAGECRDVKALCGNPIHKTEKELCQRCALEAVRTACIYGLDDKDSNICRVKSDDEDSSPVAFTQLLEEGDESNLHSAAKSWHYAKTLQAWLINRTVQAALDARLHRYDDLKGNPFFLWASAARAVVLTRFLGIRGKESARTWDGSVALDSDGLSLLDRLPITAWQRCYLLTPQTPTGECPVMKPIEVGAGTDAVKKEQVRKAIDTYAKYDWGFTPLFNMINTVEGVFPLMHGIATGWSAFNTRMGGDSAKKGIQACVDECERPKTPGEVVIGCLPRCKSIVDALGRKWEDKISLDLSKALGIKSEEIAGEAGGAVSGAIGPVIGKIVAIVVKQAGMEEMMKSIAKAGGINAEQSQNCEDSEYREEQMRLGAQSSKRDCLQRIFAKNMASALESIIVMLGNKLVDYGVDTLRTLLQGVKSALVGAAGSIPFVGGIAAIGVDLAWEALMKFGVKELLKGVVISRLPGWLKVRELATASWDQVMENPILNLVSGTILELIDAAMVYGEKSWMAIGLDVGLKALMETVETWPFLWRALDYAQKKMRKATDLGNNLQAQVIRLVEYVIDGFGVQVLMQIPWDDIKGDVKTAMNDARGAVKTIIGGSLNLIELPNTLIKIVGDLLRTLTEKLKNRAFLAAAGLAGLPKEAQEIIVELVTEFQKKDTLKAAPSADRERLKGQLKRVLTELGFALVSETPRACLSKRFLPQVVDFDLWSAMGYSPERFQSMVEKLSRLVFLFLQANNDKPFFEETPRVLLRVGMNLFLGTEILKGKPTLKTLNEFKALFEDKPACSK
ncbi:MAG: PAN domain-containing protein [Deltaproteobacteria bacterium]|nr:PAN domain-containing protein [Deltaproteobacteria bacterium]